MKSKETWRMEHVVLTCSSQALSSKPPGNVSEPILDNETRHTRLPFSKEPIEKALEGVIRECAWQMHRSKCSRKAKEF